MVRSCRAVAASPAPPLLLIFLLLLLLFVLQPISLPIPPPPKKKKKKKEEARSPFPYAPSIGWTRSVSATPLHAVPSKVTSPCESRFCQSARRSDRNGVSCSGALIGCACDVCVPGSGVVCG